MKIISEQKRSIVYFDENNKIFIKNFKPKFINRLKYFFRLRKYPGNNFYFISLELQKLNISTVQILNYSHYSVTTKKLNGIPLDKYLQQHKDKDILYNFIIVVSTLFKNNIYCGDLSYDNFFVINNSIYALDLEDYRKVRFFKRNTNEAIRRMKGKVDDWVIEEIKKNLNIN